MKKIFFILSALLLNSAHAQQRDEIKAHYRLMDSLWNAGKYKKLINYIKDVEPFFLKNNKPFYFDYFNLRIEYLAKTYVENDQYQEAEASLLEIIPTVEKAVSRMHPYYTNALTELGIIYQQTGRFSKAREAYAKAWVSMEIVRKLVPPHKYIQLGCAMINTCASTGLYDDAELYAKKIEESMSYKTYDTSDLIDYNIALSVLYGQMMALQKSEVYILKANKLAAAAKNVDFIEIAELKNILAMLLMVSNRRDSAAGILEDLLMKMNKTYSKTDDAYILTATNLTCIYTVNHDAEKGDKMLTAILNAAKGLKSRYIGVAHMNLSLFKAQEAQYSQALAHIDSAISMFRFFAVDELQTNLPADILKSIYLLKLHSGEEAKKIYNDFTTAYIVYINKNLAHLSEVEKNTLLLSYYNMANFAPSFISDHQSAGNDSTIRQTWQQHLFFKGLAGGEQTRLYRQLRQNTDTAVQNLFREWKELKQFLNTELQKPAFFRIKGTDSLLLLAENKEKQLARYFPTNNNDSSLNDPEEIFRHLLPGEAVVDFIQYSRITDGSIDSAWYGAYVLRYDDPRPTFLHLCSETHINKLYEIPPGKPANAIINSLYPYERFKDSDKKRGYDVYKAVWKPLEKHLHGIKRVYVIADGILYNVAFHVLPLEKRGYLGDKIDINYLSHASRLCDSSLRSTKMISGIQLWGGMIYDSAVSKIASGKQANTTGIEKIWPYLYQSKAEVNSIYKLAKQQNVPCELFTGKAASEKKFKEYYTGPMDVIHISTHCYFDSSFFNAPEFRFYTDMPFTLVKDPMKQVSLVLAGRNNIVNAAKGDILVNDGLLNAGEIAKLDLSGKQLAVLNACATGSGGIISKEGVYGMQRAFKMAGVPKVIISLWEVSDIKAKEMMITFYKYLLAGKPVNIAFKLAQQYMRKKGGAPYYWGGFVLVE
jgi:CHAT domain-containing protein